MRKKHQSFVNELAAMPWWVSIGVAVVAYFALKAAPQLAPAIKGPVGGVFGGLSGVAHLVVIPFIIAAVVSAVRQVSRRRMFDRQTGLDSVGNLSWRQFESLVAEAFQRQGYRVVENPSDGPDGGVDLRLRKNGRRILVQCKHWKNRTVGVKVVRELFGIVAASGADKGIVVTYGDFSTDAKAFAEGKPIELIPGYRLQRLISQAQASGNAPKTDPATPACPRCGSGMRLRTAKTGSSAGRQFWGCERFPECRGIQPLP